jgi:hypothetical protein
MPAHSHDSHRFGPGPVIRRSLELATRTGGSLGSMDLAGDAGEQLDHLLTARMLDELVDRVADKLEERVIVELERRGRRSLPEVF